VKSYFIKAELPTQLSFCAFSVSVEHIKPFGGYSFATRTEGSLSQAGSFIFEKDSSYGHGVVTSAANEGTRFILDTTCGNPVLAEVTTYLEERGRVTCGAAA
jgi:hypothetical protein